MEKGIDLAYSTIEGMMTEYEMLSDQNDPVSKFKGDIAVEILTEALARIEGCKEEI